MVTDVIRRFDGVVCGSITVKSYGIPDVGAFANVAHIATKGIFLWSSCLFVYSFYFIIIVVIVVKCIAMRNICVKDVVCYILFVVRSVALCAVVILAFALRAVAVCAYFFYPALVLASSVPPYVLLRCVPSRWDLSNFFSLPYITFCHISCFVCTFCPIPFFFRFVVYFVLSLCICRMYVLWHCISR